ncbi:DUF6157 family protein [Gynurincola endophyticus]|uniref:DUF6157 family protein n=1 Tax=Gynurincola endophyticus TaxID=2479004 RepID=UPI000F8D3B13|nr:DUF6157 family protein [Gynurincola endophyticus]
MKVHTTNYYNAFIAISEDCNEEEGKIPPMKEEAPSIAALQFNLIQENPYKYTSDDVVFQVYAQKNNINKADYVEAREKLFSKGQPCLRASPLTKKYGWGIHFNEEGKMAIYGCGSEEYKNFVSGDMVTIVKAMRNKKS